MKRGTIAALLLSGSIASSATAQSLAVKPGAWEMTTTVSGDVIAPGVVEKMTPERRARVEQRMTEGHAPRSRTTCVKQEDLDQDRFLQSRSADCTVKAV